MKCAGCIHSKSANICNSQGNQNAEVVFVGDFPRGPELATDKIYSGIGGRLLLSFLQKENLDPFQFYYTNLCMCQESSTSKALLAACRSRLLAELTLVKPKVVFAMGTLVAQQLMGSTEKIEVLNGKTKWSKELNAYVCAMVSPGAAYYEPSKGEMVVTALRKGFNKIDALPDETPVFVPIVVAPKTVEGALEVAKMLEDHNNWMSCDIETDGFDFTRQDILSIGFSPDGKQGIIFRKSLIELPVIQQAIERIFANPLNLFGFQNGKFDKQYMQFPGIPGQKPKNCVIRNPRIDFDTMLAHYCCDERQGTHGLKTWAREEFDAPNWDEALKVYLPNKDTPYSAIPEDKLHFYQAYDLCYTYKGIDHFRKKMEKENTAQLHDLILVPAANALAEIEMRGVRVDRAMLERLFAEMNPKLEEAMKHLEEAAFKVGFTPERYQKETGAKEKPKRFNPKSHPQMSFVAYDLCGMPLFEGKKTCNKDAVEVYQHRHPFWKAVAEYKQLNDLFGIYVKGMLDRIDADDFMRADFLLHGTVTGRLSCHDPNLQNIPRKSFVKDLFIASEETVIVSADYKTLEVVVAAILSNDPIMKAPFLEGKDYHTQTMMNVFGEQVKELALASETKDFDYYVRFLQNPMMLEMRNPAGDYMYTKIDPDLPETWIPKPLDQINFGKLYDLIVDYLRFLTKFITFGIMYGRKAKSLALGELNCSINEAQTYINNFFAKYPDFRNWQLSSIHKAKTEGFVQNPFGFKRRWLYINSDELYLLENQAVNTPIQGTASYICLKALTALHNWFKETGWGWVLFTVHDSIVSEVKKKHLIESLSQIKAIMEAKPFDTEVPFVADLEIGPRYGKVEGIELKDGKWVPSKPAKASTWLKALLAEVQ